MILSGGRGGSAGSHHSAMIIWHRAKTASIVVSSRHLARREGEVGHRVRAAHDGVLTALGQDFHPVGDIGVEGGDRDGSLVQQIGLALADALDQRERERAVSPSRGFLRKLRALRGGEGDQAVLGLGKIVDEARHVDARRAEAARRNSPICVAGVEEQHCLAGDRGTPINLSRVQDR
jgi:hypothetical protein